MNTPNPSSPPIPPQIPPSLIPPGPAPLGDNPAEREPITSPIGAVEAILRQPRRLIFQLRQPGSGPLLGGMLFVAVVCSLVYGVVVGTFSMGPQLWAAPVKIAAGLMISALICLPSLYIFTCLSGSQARLAEMCGLLAGLLMLMSILLVGFAPVAWLFSQSTQSVAWMGTLHLLFWLISTLFGLRFLHAGFSHSQARSRAGLYTWIAIFVLVALQMTTALRPLVGRADTLLPTEKKFFVTHWGDCFKAASPAEPQTPQ
jgi:hypothetical protein